MHQQPRQSGDLERSRIAINRREKWLSSEPLRAILWGSKLDPSVLARVFKMRRLKWKFRGDARLNGKSKGLDVKLEKSVEVLRDGRSSKALRANPEPVAAGLLADPTPEPPPIKSTGSEVLKGA